MLKDNSQEIYIKILRAVFTLLGKKPLQFLSVKARSRSGRKVKQKSFLISLVYFWLWLKNIAVASQTAVLGEELDAESMSIPCPKKTCVHIPFVLYTAVFGKLPLPFLMQLFESRPEVDPAGRSLRVRRHAAVPFAVCIAARMGPRPHAGRRWPREIAGDVTFYRRSRAAVCGPHGGVASFANGTAACALTLSLFFKFPIPISTLGFGSNKKLQRLKKEIKKKSHVGNHPQGGITRSVFGKVKRHFFICSFFASKPEVDLGRKEKCT